MALSEEESEEEEGEDLPSRGNEQESRVKCKYCNVHLYLGGT